MERGDRSGVATFFWAEPVAAGDTVVLADDALRHALVRRMDSGDIVHLASGQGSVARGRVTKASKSAVSVEIDGIEFTQRPPALDVLAPIADRERMLWAAEKLVEHQLSAWRPVMYARSRSVASRGEGPKFAEKLVARMKSAVEQSGSAWLPDVYPESEMAAAMNSVASSHGRIILDATGQPLAGMNLTGPIALAVGPEGGFEQAEIHGALALGWRLASLGNSLLRFETAMVSAAAVIRSYQHIQRSS